VADVARAFAEAWATCGDALPEGDLPRSGSLAPAGDVSLRVVADKTGAAGLFRLDILVAALARKTLWLADAYFAGMSAYVQALLAAARDGVDVRLLVPGRGSDMALMQAISRAGYRTLLEGGVRVFEWNGPMMHAKTAVADGRWSRVGSTNLNVASWLSNWELDVVVEDENFGRIMAEQYEKDLAGSREVILGRRSRVRPADGVRLRRARGGGGSASRAAAGAVRLGHALGAAFSPRIHGPAERRLLVPAGVILVLVAVLGAFLPQALGWPLALVSLWLGAALLLRAARVPLGAEPRARK
jgi:cardiolipin synthase